MFVYGWLTSEGVLMTRSAKPLEVSTMLHVRVFVDVSCWISNMYKANCRRLPAEVTVQGRVHAICVLRVVELDGSIVVGEICGLGS